MFKIFAAFNINIIYYKTHIYYIHLELFFGVKNFSVVFLLIGDSTPGVVALTHLLNISP